VTLQVRPSTNEWAAVRFRVIDKRGIPLLSTRFWGLEKSRSLQLAPGDYVIEARTGNSTPIRKPLTIADQPVELTLP